MWDSGYFFGVCMGLSVYFLWGFLFLDVVLCVVLVFREFELIGWLSGRCLWFCGGLLVWGLVVRLYRCFYLW